MRVWLSRVQFDFRGDRAGSVGSKKPARDARSAFHAESKASHFPVYAWRAIACGHLRSETSARARRGQEVADRFHQRIPRSQRQPPGLAVHVQQAWTKWI